MDNGTPVKIARVKADMRDASSSPAVSGGAVRKVRW